MEITFPHNQSIWACIDQVSRFQEQVSSFLPLYEKFIIKSQEQNQFLSEETHNHHEDSIEEQPQYHCQRQKNSNLQENNSYFIDSRRVIEENIEFEPRMINLSRIFEDISLGEQVKAGESSSMVVELQIESIKTFIALERGENSYNLSNFSSFNNQKNGESSTHFEIKDLLLKIQEKAGRQLSRKGIASIINQLETAASPEVDSKEKMRQSEITQHSLKASCVQPAFTTHNAFDFELETRRLKERKDLSNIPEQHTLLERRQINRDPAAADQDQKQNKRSSQANFRKKALQPLPTKEIRIIRKNCLKSSLVMTYTDPKQLENFCISNKIYGREKEKIAKAIRECKNIVSLD